MARLILARARNFFSGSSQARLWLGSSRLVQSFTPAARNYFTVSETETKISAGSSFLKKKTMKNVSKRF
jgi:hypothetical protein